MGSVIYELKRESNESLNELRGKLANDLSSRATVVCNHIEGNQNVEVLLFVLEKYYARNNGMASLTVQCVNYGKVQHAVIVGTGGGVGILNINLGANAELAGDAKIILNRHGFT